MTRKRYWVTLASKVAKVRTYKGYPSNRQQELELTHSDVQAMQQRVLGIPVRYNHDDNTFLGKVTNTRVNANGSWDAELELSVETPEGEVIMKAIDDGLIDGVSLQHELFSNKPKEVSVCVKGARPGTKFIRKPANSDLYRCDADPEFTISAAHEQSEVDVVEHDIFTVLHVAASAMPDADATMTDAPSAAAAPPAVAVPSPAAAPQPDETKSPEVEKELELAAAAESLLPRTKEVKDLLRNAHNIPSKAEKEKIADTVADIEMKATDALEENAALKAEIEKLKAAAERADKINQQQYRLMGDTVAASKSSADALEHAVDAFSSPEQAANTKRILASADPAVFGVVANLVGGIAKAATAKSPEAVAQLFSQKKLAEWMKTRAAKKGGLPVKPQEMDTTQQFADWAHKAAPPTVMASADHGNSYEDPDDGEPVARPSMQYVKLVAASASGKTFRSQQELTRAQDKAWREELAKPAFDPGAGLNWPHAGICTKPEQRQLFMGHAVRTTRDVPSHCRIADLIGEGEAAQLWRKGVPARRRELQFAEPEPTYQSSQAYN